MISAFAETNRLPFDLPEAEQELIGGFHTEYSAMKFAMFFLGEYANVITTSFLMVILFFGGWHFPFIATATMLGFVGFITKFVVITLKVSLVILFIMLIRWTIPRFRFDQLMSLAWKVMIPLALVNLVAVMVVLELMRVTGVSGLVWLLLPISLVAILLGAGYSRRRRHVPRPRLSSLTLSRTGQAGKPDQQNSCEVHLCRFQRSRRALDQAADELGLADRLYLPAILQGLQHHRQAPVHAEGDAAVPRTTADDAGELPRRPSAQPRH